MKNNYLPQWIAIGLLVIGSQFGMQAQVATLNLERASFEDIEALTQTLTPTCSPVVYNDVANALQTWDGSKWRLKVHQMNAQERQTFEAVFNALDPAVRETYRDILVFDSQEEAFYKIQTQVSGVFQPVVIGGN